MRQEHVLVFPVQQFPALAQASNRFTCDISLLPKILSVAIFMDRDSAEHDPRYKQIIPYSILRYEQSVFRYRRSSRVFESRLRGFYSLGVGGHINRSDNLLLVTDAMSIIEWSRERELREEFHVENSCAPRLIGIINDESNEVGRFHFGVVYEYWLDTPVVKPKEKHLHVDYSFVAQRELRQHKEEYESWSQIIIDDYLVATQE